MRILMIGSAVSPETADRIALQSRVKPSPAPVNFQYNLIKGFCHLNTVPQVRSLPPIAMFPGSRSIAWGRRKEPICGGVQTVYIPAVNLPVLKQLSAALSSFALTLRWGMKYRKEPEKVVLLYSQYPYLTGPAGFVCRRLHLKTCAFVTDPIRYRSGCDEKAAEKRLLLRLHWALTERSMKAFDGYIPLTEALAGEYVTDGQPALLLEGIADPDRFADIEPQEKAFPPAIMYAGALTEGFGIPKLLEAFRQVRGECELWLYGSSGDCEPLIRQAAGEDPRIRYFGAVSHREVLTAMRRAACLISVKPVGTVQARYQFPSKLMEYMASGTPTLSTRAEGIPAEYFGYLYPIEEDTPDGIRTAVEGVLRKTEEERAADGARCVRFVTEEKNCDRQAGKVLGLLREIVRKEERS